MGPFFPVVVVLLVMTGALAVGVGFRYLFITSPDQAAVNRAPRISDIAFERDASAVCHDYVHVFDTETTLGKTPSQREAGAFLESIATSYDQMVARLRGVHVNVTADGPAVATWLDQWAQYDAYGHRYAAALTAGTERDLVTHDTARIDALLRQRNAFAQANHMSACVFH